MLYEDRKIEFRELSHILLTEKAIKSTGIEQLAIAGGVSRCF